MWLWARTLAGMTDGFDRLEFAPWHAAKGEIHGSDRECH